MSHTAASASLLRSIPATCELLGGVSRSTVYRLAAAGDLRIVKIAGRSMVTTESIDRLVQVSS